jgi:hypothetical protein
MQVSASEGEDTACGQETFIERLSHKPGSQRMKGGESATLGDEKSQIPPNMQLLTHSIRSPVGSEGMKRTNR